MTTTEASLVRLQHFFIAKIPLARAMKLRVVPCGEGFALEAPVAANANHLGTAFGGSINAIALLTAYGYLWLATSEHDQMHVVVQESAIQYRRPVRQTIRGLCIPPGEQEWSGFERQLQENGGASLKLRVSIEESDTTAATFAGTFLARRAAPPP